MDVSDLAVLEDDYVLLQSAAREFDEAGFVFLPRVCAPSELEPYAKLIEEVTYREAGELLPMEERGTYAKAFIQVINLWRKDPRVARFVLAKRFGKIAADLLGVDGVRLYHDQALFKEPGGGPTPWHQDQYYWPLDGVKTVTMWMPLRDISETTKGMRFAKGSHKEGSFTSVEISDTSDAVYQQIIADRGFEVCQIGAMAAGDATFHAGWSIHGAPANPSGDMRAIMTVIYFEDGAHVSQPDHSDRENDFRAFFPGLQPGDLAASELNPLVFSRRQ